MSKRFLPIENNPDVLTLLSKRMGLPSSLAFHDVYSLTDSSLLSLIPRPVLALLAIIPMTPAWEKARAQEDCACEYYDKSGPSEPVTWFRQTIRHACGSIGILHCAMNGAKSEIIKDSILDDLLRKAIPLRMDDRAQLLHDSKDFEDAHKSVMHDGDSATPNLEDDVPFHFVAFVKGTDGHIYELEGSRKGPLDRGALAEDEDVLSEKALDLGVRRIINNEREAENPDLRFSITALAATLD